MEETTREPEQEAPEVKIDEKKLFDPFWNELNRLKSSISIKDFCDLNLKEVEDLKNACDGIRCNFKMMKAKMMQNGECFGYRWNTQTKIKILDAFVSFSEKFNGQLLDIENRIKRRLEEERMKSENLISDYYSKNKLDGWNSEEEVEQMINNIKNKRQ